MSFSWKKIATVLMGIVIGATFVIGFASPASADTLYFKVGTNTTRAHVFAGAKLKNLYCFAPAGYDTTMCVRFDRETIYVKSDKKDGYFKLGQIKNGGKTYRCQNNHANTSGNGTWVGCHWNLPEDLCWFARTGYGQADWYKLSYPGPIKCD